MLAGSATLLGAFGSSAFSAERKTYLATRDIFVGGGLYVPDAREPSRRLATIAIVDIGKRQIDRFAMDFFAHGFALKRGAWGIAATFQKIGPGAAEIDIVNGKVLRTITPEKDRLFYGHGAYSLDGRLLYSTERDEKRKTGLIAIRDAGTLAYLGEFPTYGDHPHDCHLIDDGATMVVTNGGGAMGEGSPASLTYIGCGFEPAAGKNLFPAIPVSIPGMSRCLPRGKRWWCRRPRADCPTKTSVASALC